jgi:hypothetical protein
MKGGLAVPYDRRDIIPFSVWRHVPDGACYLVLGIGLCSSNGPREHLEESVIYVSLSYQKLRYRVVDEFLDGRFEPVRPGVVVKT